MASERHPEWTLHFDSERIKREGMTQNRWWSGLGDLMLETHTWLGARYPDGGMLLSVGDVKYTQTLPGRRTTIQLAVTPESLRRLLLTDLGAIDVTLGWIYRRRFGPWTRIPRYFRGRLGQADTADGRFSAEVETYMGDIDRGVPLYWSHETAEDGDLYAEQAAELAGGIETRWPPFTTPQPRG